MLSLRDLESAFGAWILHGTESPALAELVAPDGWPVEERLDIYRNNVFASLTKALASTFPAVSRLVDERFFAYAAHEFIRSRPPRESCLAAYGAEFPDFLGGFPPCRELAYLADVARLEWLMQQAAQAGELPALAPAALAAVPEDEAQHIVFGLQPSIAYLRSFFPVDRIWAANQSCEASEVTITLDAGGAALEVRRAGGQITYRRLDQASFAFRAALGAGVPLGAAADAALAEDADFDLACALPALFLDRAVVSIGLERDLLSGGQHECP
jgi:hypothetical protein